MYGLQKKDTHKFEPGMTVTSSESFMHKMSEEGESDELLLRVMDRHLSGEWGSVTEAEARENDEALASGEQVLSVWHTAKGTEFWLVTEAEVDGKRYTSHFELARDY